MSGGPGYFNFFCPDFTETLSSVPGNSLTQQNDFQLAPTKPTYLCGVWDSGGNGRNSARGACKVHLCETSLSSCMINFMSPGEIDFKRFIWLAVYTLSYNITTHRLTSRSAM